MYNILVVSDDKQLNETINKTLGAEINKIFCDSKSAQEEIKKKNYDLVLAPPSLIAAFRGGEEDTESRENIEKHYTEKITELFLLRSGELEEYLKSVRNEISIRIFDAASIENMLCNIYSAAIDNAFIKNEWLELYISHEDFKGDGASYLKDRLMVLYREYTSLYPPMSSDKTEEVILYILNNPESDLRQKTIASKLYVNSSYLSTVFAAQTGGRFVDYLTSVKLRRAAYLLMNSTLRVSEIAARLDYKDIGYFSRLFKAHYSIPPSEYRIPDDYTYVI